MYCLCCDSWKPDKKVKNFMTTQARTGWEGEGGNGGRVGGGGNWVGGEGKRGPLGLYCLVLVVGTGVRSEPDSRIHGLGYDILFSTRHPERFYRLLNPGYRPCQPAALTTALTSPPRTDRLFFGFLSSHIGIPPQQKT
jgi:hypothetical protein